MVVTIKTTDAGLNGPAVVDITIMDQASYLESIVLLEGMRQEALRGNGPRVAPVATGPIFGGANEPIVSHAVAAFMRGSSTSPKDFRSVWSACWSAFRRLMMRGAGLSSGDLGEIGAQAVFCIAHDHAERQGLPADLLVQHQQPQSPLSSFVPVDRFLTSLLGTPTGEESTREWVRIQEQLSYAPHRPFVNFERFTRASRQYRVNNTGAVSRTDLIVAWLRKEAIVGAVKQPTWDFILPVYAGDLRLPLKHDKFSALIVQVKNQEDDSSADPALPTFVVGDFEEQTGRKWSPQEFLLSLCGST